MPNLITDKTQCEVFFDEQLKALDFLAAGTDPRFYAPINDLFTPISADEYTWMKVRLSNLSPSEDFEFFYMLNGNGVSASTCCHFPIKPNTEEMITYICHIPSANIYAQQIALGNEAYKISSYQKGTLTGLRIDGFDNNTPGRDKTKTMPASGDEMYIEYIAFYQSKEAALEGETNAVVAMDDTTAGTEVKLNTTPIVYDFTKEATLAVIANAKDATFTHDTVLDAKGALKIEATNYDPRADMKSLDGEMIDANSHRWMRVELYNDSPANYFQLYYSGSTGGYGGGTVCMFPIEAAKEWKTYILDIHEANVAGSLFMMGEEKATKTSPWENAMIEKFRLDAMHYAPNGNETKSATAAGDTLYIRSIGFYASEEAAKAASGAVETTAAPVTTQAPDTTKAPEITTAPVTTQAPATTKAPEATPATADMTTVYLCGAMLLTAAMSTVLLRRKAGK